MPALCPCRATWERFLREARIAAQLRHPGIVAVHEVTVIDGLPVSVSEFVEGVSLAELAKQQRLGLRESAALVAEVAEALEPGPCPGRGPPGHQAGQHSHGDWLGNERPGARGQG